MASSGSLLFHKDSLLDGIVLSSTLFLSFLGGKGGDGSRVSLCGPGRPGTCYVD